LIFFVSHTKSVKSQPPKDKWEKEQNLHIKASRKKIDNNKNSIIMRFLLCISNCLIVLGWILFFLRHMRLYSLFHSLILAILSIFIAQTIIFYSDFFAMHRTFLASPHMCIYSREKKWTLCEMNFYMRLQRETKCHQRSDGKKFWTAFAWMSWFLEVYF
jgi:purine-cytosine permease-like protein